MNQTQAYRILWQEKPDGSAKLFRLYGTSPQIYLPSKIEGHSLTEIAPYCFAEYAHLPPEEELKITEIQEDTKNLQTADSPISSPNPFLQELCKTAVEEVVVPDTVQKIGSYAFYNCRNLTTLQIGPALQEIGSDAFMNTLSFHHIRLCCKPDEPSGIRQILSQISSDMEVEFAVEGETKAALLFPEYYESYDEIAPAHLFGRNIQGEGFRARQCIKDGRVDFAGYDAVFPQACVEESEETLGRMAMNRCRYGYGLSGRCREIYQNYLSENSRRIGIRLVKKKDMENLQFLCQSGILCGAPLSDCVQTASETEWPEGAAYLLRHMAEGQINKKCRYDFDACI